MTIEQLRTTHRATPFQPFTIRMADGKQFLIPHPDFLSMSPAGRTAVGFIRGAPTFAVEVRSEGDYGAGAE